MSARESSYPVFDLAPAIIANGGSLSANVTCGGFCLHGIIMPADWTAAALTFQGSFDDAGEIWNDIYDNQGNEYEISAPVAGKYHPLDPTVFAAVPRVRIRSGTAALPVLQLAARELNLVFRPY